MIEKTFVLNNEEGLHARPACVLAKAAMKFTCDMKLFKGENKDKVYQPKSVLSVMTVGASSGDAVTITAEGEDESQAMDMMTSLFASNFEE